MSELLNEAEAAHAERLEKARRETAARNGYDYDLIAEDVPRSAEEARRIAESTAKEWGESLDTPDDSKAREKAVEVALATIADYVPSIHSFRARDALAQAYDAGMADCARLLPQDPPQDVMAGAIDRLRAVVGEDLFNTREFGLALNEAFRNGMRHAQSEVALPVEVEVHIPGLVSPATDNHNPEGYWRAYRGQGATSGRPIYTIVNPNPNDVAVGRFKASLRKFLGVS